MSLTEMITGFANETTDARAHLEVVQPLCVDSQHFVLLVQGKQVHITNPLFLFLLNILGLRLDPS